MACFMQLDTYVTGTRVALWSRQQACSEKSGDTTQLSVHADRDRGRHLAKLHDDVHHVALLVALIVLNNVGVV